MVQFNLTLMGLCLAGFLLSSYAYSVEVHVERAKQLGVPYRAYCDIGPFSCTEVFSSEFSSTTHLFGLPKVPNALVAMIYYMVEMLCCWHPTLILIISTPGILVTVCFAFILTVILHDLCIVCCLTYVVNVSTVYVAYRWWRQTAARNVAAAFSSSTKSKKHV
ncbi:vitamin K epoxide reductase, putative [Leishmania panamensis]|uniref:vitamin-K-epoxide reductase (warfarin-sensitive) n=1 Tax=Leishmania panamensis TaxID=5679 RepID=A0A088RUA2_LEIPA|nr:vitamin K epoxide reductase, putative [Leishmania panamensis]AIN99598.1 vitamin K epoxide reductase, putative [Leishmania panamensis]